MPPLETMPNSKSSVSLAEDKPSQLDGTSAVTCFGHFEFDNYLANGEV